MRSLLTRVTLGGAPTGVPARLPEPVNTEHVSTLNDPVNARLPLEITGVCGEV